jgi:fibronectin-binding autotransporter adhesin
MKPRNRFRPTVEMLEDRLTPSLTVMTDAAGNLNVSGTPDPQAGTASQPITISEPTQNMYTVTEGITPVGGTFFAPNGVNIDFSHSLLDDTVLFDLMGNQINGNLTLREGPGNDAAVAISPGSVGGNVTFTNVNNVDTTAGVNIGSGLSIQDGKKNLATTIDLGAPVLETIGGNVQIAAGNGTVTVNIALGGNVAIGDNLTTTLGNGTHVFNFTAGSSVGGKFSYSGGSGADSVTIGGTVGGSLFANLGAAFGTSAQNSFTLQTTAVVAKSLTVLEGSTPNGDIVNIMGNGLGAGGALIGGSASFALGSTGTTAATGNTWTFAAGASINGPAIAYLGGPGVNTDTFNGSTGRSHAYFILGPANDSFTLGPNTNLASLYIDFGPGTDSFTNNAGATAPPLTLKNL